MREEICRYNRINPRNSGPPDGGISVCSLFSYPCVNCIIVFNYSVIVFLCVSLSLPALV
uniref:Uncharacterized protein n=1 Tax=Anguilla anguilla TaxID=7936 RepID=A0A0E9XUS7_ANGAN